MMVFGTPKIAEIHEFCFPESLSKIIDILRMLCKMLSLGFLSFCRGPHLDADEACRAAPRLEAWDSQSRLEA